MFGYNLAVVKERRSLFIVPVAILVAFIFVILSPSPLNVVALISPNTSSL